MNISDEAMANLLSTWAHNLECIDTQHEGSRVIGTTVAEMRRLVDELSPKVRIRERIILTRLWSEDREYIERWNEKNPIVGWMRLIRAEFDGCEVEPHHGEVASVIDWLSSSVTITCGSNGDMTALFSMVLDFNCRQSEVESDDPASIIQQLFFDAGGVTGNFVIGRMHADVRTEKGA
jgi:hypothetical protein